MTRVRDDLGALPCCWDTCERDGSTSYVVVVTDNVGPRRERVGPIVYRAPAGAREIRYVFCSERHKMLYVNAHANRGNLPSGARGLLS